MATGASGKPIEQWDGVPVMEKIEAYLGKIRHVPDEVTINDITRTGGYVSRLGGEGLITAGDLRLLMSAWISFSRDFENVLERRRGKLVELGSRALDMHEDEGMTTEEIAALVIDAVLFGSGS